MAGFDPRRQRTACFTGHRDVPGMTADRVRQRTMEAVEALIRRGYRYFGAGGARGFDMLAAETVLELRARYPAIHLILVLPFPDQFKQDRGWSKKEIERYHRLQSQASKVVVLQQDYSSGVYYRRNRHLADFSSVCVAYLTRPNSGTSYTVNYARSRSLEIINVAE